MWYTRAYIRIQELVTDLSKMVDGPNEGQALLGCKVTKPLELERFRHSTVRIGPSKTGLGAGVKGSMECELCEASKSESGGVHFYVHPKRAGKGSEPRR